MARNGGLDILKIVLAFMVVAMHAGFFTDLDERLAYLALNGLFRIAVPVFLLINGYFFYQVFVSGERGKWLVRVLILYVVWMAFYAPFWLPGSQYSLLSWVFRVGRTMFFGYYHLWYLIGMLGAGVLMIFVGNAKTKVLVIAASGAFLGGVAIQYMASYHLLATGRLADTFTFTWSHRNFLLFAFPFFCGGFLINKHKLLEKLSVGNLRVAVCAGLALLLIESSLNFVASPSHAALDNMLSLAIVSPALFMLIMKTVIPVRSKEISLYSTGIYLVHILVLYALQATGHMSPTLLTLLTAFIATGIAHCLIRLHRRFTFIL
nr:acyltransferase [Massilia sp. JS1662]